MNQSALLAVEAARHCRERIVAWKLDTNVTDLLVDKTLSMCHDIERHTEEWPIVRVHRWLGFIFGVLAAREILSREKQSAMMRALFISYPESGDDALRDDQDPGHPFCVDIGGSE